MTGLLSISTLLFIGAIFAVFMMIRNNWVYKERERLNQECYESRIARIRAGDLGVSEEPWFSVYYPTYTQMMWRFWVWDIEKFRSDTPLREE